MAQPKSKSTLEHNVHVLTLCVINKNAVDTSLYSLGGISCATVLC